MELVSRMLDESIPSALRDALRRSAAADPRLAQDERIRRLEDVPILAECTRKQLKAVAAISRVVEVPAGTVLTRTGAAGAEFFIIVDGSATVEISPRKRRHLGPDDFFGEMSLLDGGPRSATVVADTDLRLLVILRRNFLSLLNEVPDLTLKILYVLSRRIRALEQTPRD